MKPPPFEYRAPATIGEALALLERHGYDAKVLAGGQSLVPLLNFRLARPAVIVDINAVEGLDRIVDDEGTREVSIGALVRLADAERSDVVARRCPLLVEALRYVGHRTVRNRGTVGGSLAHADPAAELPLVLRALDGRVRAVSPRGGRELPAADLFVGYLQTALAPDEILVEARFPWIGRGVRWSFIEFSRRSGDFALAAACVVLSVGPSGIEGARIAVAGGGPVPIRASEAEAALVRGGEGAIRDAAEHAAAACDVESDIHASAEYRRELVSTLVRRAVVAATAA